MVFASTYIQRRSRTLNVSESVIVQQKEKDVPSVAVNEENEDVFGELGTFRVFTTYVYMHMFPLVRFMIYIYIYILYSARASACSSPCDTWMCACEFVDVCTYVYVCHNNY